MTGARHGSEFGGDWTPAVVARLKEYTAAGKTYGQAATMLNAEFGKFFSRNSTLGKAHRLGIVPVKASTPAKAGNNPFGAKGTAGLRRFSTLYPQAQRSPDRPLPKPRLVALTCEPRHWITRRFGECAFPVSGEGADLLSCCAPVAAEGGSYCPAHRKVMTITAADSGARRRAWTARQSRKNPFNPKGEAA